MSEANLPFYSQLAYKSLLYELNLSPKPGLVDQFDSGAHKDMDYQTFLASMDALAPFFDQYIEVGWHHHHQTPQEIFQQLRQIGLKAEKAMFQATDGVNTHKGINFSMALVLGATGIYLAGQDTKNTSCKFTPQDSQAICDIVKQLSSHLIQTDLQNLETKTNLSYGEKLYLEYGIQGPRGEAALGFPTLTQQALPFFRKERALEKDVEFAQLRLLLYLMTFVEDGNLIHRGGLESWQIIEKEALQLLEKRLTKKELIAALSDYNQVLIRRHLSPGGSADFLSLTFYFAFLENLL